MNMIETLTIQISGAGHGLRGAIILYGLCKTLSMTFHLTPYVLGPMTRIKTSMA